MGTVGQPCPWDRRHIVPTDEAPARAPEGTRGEVPGDALTSEGTPRTIAVGVVGLSAPTALIAGSTPTPATHAPSPGRGNIPDGSPTTASTLPLTLPVSADSDAAAVPSSPVVHSRQVTLDTSHDAHGRQTYSVADAGRRLVLAALADYGPMTDFDLAARLTRHLGRTVKQVSCGKRRGELRDMGLVVDTGRRGRSDTDSPCIVWALTPAGEREARTMAVAS